ncbi:hypothetical protein GMORB2_7748 [Geosmithia morbida]|uniref:Uncharacterized protein n=1 Tax=Geosmithia morbida TaxID=1094350 RepID=A0A9P4YU78_9HYPO|nr:uncharacterized protein GMORB2_7748 [Geosmithia morbida]KAF4122155.1 hypothetical protein GMORB2_7748 [Geosmithia morbida]
MDQSPGHATWWSPASLWVPNTSLVVRSISWACLGLGILFIGPFAFLILLDILLWLWRTLGGILPFTATTPQPQPQPQTVPPPPTRRTDDDEATTTTAATASGVNERDTTTHKRTSAK